jgi:metallo-beta-lactamase family protein
MTRYMPNELDSVVLTHAHMDHSGLVPRLAKAGFRGPVRASAATADLLPVLWEDGARIQEHEAEWKSRKNNRQGGGDVEALYDLEDAKVASSLLVPVPFETEFEPSPELYVRFFPAGHILGAASVMVTAEEEDGETKIVFSGDIGREGQLLIPDPSIPPKSDAIFMETTYGNRLHKNLDDSEKEFVAAVNEAYKDGGKILIPAFAVERTQEIIYLLSTAWHKGLIPKNLPVWLDSPLATLTSEVFLKHPDLFDEESKKLFDSGMSPLRMTTLKISRTAEESQKLNELPGSAVIIAGSGMANAGRILHHLKHNVWRPNCHVIFVGFQAQGTTGRRLVEGAETIKLFREIVAVKAKIHTIGGFSGHADQKELIEWLRPQVHDNLVLSLVHGEESSSLEFEKLANRTFPEVTTRVPVWLELLDITPRERAFRAPEGVESLIPAGARDYRDTPEYKSLMNRLARLKTGFEPRKTPFDPHSLANLEALLNMAEEIILREAP